LSQSYKLFCGDFFQLPADALGDVRAAYDRGCLVALPDEMRRRYADHLTHVMPSGSRVLVISYDYDQIETY
ncbi:MAG: thiopurine S-methyltransferase, partial [Gammaproteobacteria bacterium]|nr:thiopurine S-methyltransferase [Gammaproteobacteria bacterium]